MSWEFEWPFNGQLGQKFLYQKLFFEILLPFSKFLSVILLMVFSIFLFILMLISCVLIS